MHFSNSKLKLIKIMKYFKIVQSQQQIIGPFSHGMLRHFHMALTRHLRRIPGKSSVAQLDYLQKLNATNVKGQTQQLLDESVTFSAEKGIDPLDVWHSDSYDESARNMQRRQQGIYYSAPNLDQEKLSVLLFPGQGTQFVGMGKHLLEYPNVKEMYDVASEILQYDLLDLSLQGPANKLNQTKFQQPAILVASLASVEKLRQERPQALECCIGTAGFSLGEITALTFAGALSFESAIQLTKVRAEAMEIASDMQRSGMMSVFYGPGSKLSLACQIAKEYCQRLNLETIDCKIASYLYPHCKVIAGNEEALNFIMENKNDFNLKKCRRIDVSGAFHTDLMKPAAFALKEALENIQITKPLIKVFSNVDGKRYLTTNQIRKQLVKQLYMPVKWEQILHTLYERPAGVSYPYTYECGPGNSLRTILKKVDAKAAEKCWCY